MSERPRLGRLHVITDELLQLRSVPLTHLELGRLALDGGADTLQLRDKRAQFWQSRGARLAGALVELCHARGASLIVDDEVEVTILAEADGVHLGRHDAGPESARAQLGPRPLIGGTANSLEEARRVWLEPVDYLGVGPVHGTRSKDNPAPPLGLEALAAICAASPRPVVAIGGILPEHVEAILAAGAHGIAVLSGIVCADDPARATARYADALRAAGAPCYRSPPRPAESHP